MEHIPPHRNEEDRVNFPDCRLSLNAYSQSQVRHRYAWLEYEDGHWHFLTGLFEDPSESMRRWSNHQCALDELIHEGWTVIRAYPSHLSINKNLDNLPAGYGLMRTLH